MSVIVQLISFVVSGSQELRVCQDPTVSQFFHRVGVPQFVSGFPAGVIALCVAVDVKLLVCPWEERCSGVTCINIFVNLSLLQKVFF